MADHIKDDRFSHISSDPRFRATPKSVRKVKIDRRFQSLFTDKRFQLKYSVDKRGRPIEQSSNENFRKYYDISSEESSDESNSDEKQADIKTNGSLHPQGQEKKKRDVSKKSNSDNNKNQKPKGTNWVVTPSHELKEEESRSSSEVKEENSIKTDRSKDVNKKLKNSENTTVPINAGDLIDKARMTDEVKVKLKDPNIDYARGMGTLLSDSSSEESSSDSESEDGEVDHHWGELDKDADTTDEATDRLAVLHMDWDRIRAVDLMVLFNSFLPAEGMIKSVTIYPSEFGLARMKEEEAKGPIELTTMRVENDEELDEESKDGKRYHMERLRQYQLNRLKYYYAVIQFDSVDTANKVYTECDNMEYESSSTKLDLRFVPQDETFDQDPHEVCSSMPEPSKYKPRVFTNSALQQGKVELTWDEMDPGRQEFTKKILKNADNVDNADLHAYLAHSSEDEEEEEDDASDNNKDAESDGEVKEDDKIAKYKSLLASLEEEEEKKKQRDVDLEITWGVGLKEKAEKAVKDKLNAPKTPFEEMLEKRKQNKKLKKAEKLKQKEMASDTGNSLSSDDDIPSDIDMNDPYFKEELKGSKSKKKSRKVDEEESEEVKQKKAELELLLLDENDTELQKSHFSIKQIQDQESDTKKKKRRKQLKKKPAKEVLPEKDDFQVDVVDDRFNALFTSHHFNIDPADPHYHKTKAMDAILSEKLKRRKQDDHVQGFSSTKQRKTDPELLQLVQSIKNKTKQKI